MSTQSIVNGDPMKNRIEMPELGSMGSRQTMTAHGLDPYFSRTTGTGAPRSGEYSNRRLLLNTHSATLTITGIEWSG